MKVAGWKLSSAKDPKNDYIIRLITIRKFIFV